MKNPKIKKAMIVLEFISSDKEAREYYEARQKEIRDKISQMMFAKEEGEHLKAVKIAKSMLSDGLELSMISKYTQLEMDELREIKSTQKKSLIGTKSESKASSSYKLMRHLYLS